MKNVTKLYFILVSLVSVIGLAIGYGVAGYSYFMAKYITQEEYLLQNYYEIEACNGPDYTKQTGPDNKPIERTPEEKEACKADATARVLAKRSLDTKESVIGGLIRGTIALILFVTHFPIMLKRGQDEKNA